MLKTKWRTGKRIRASMLKSILLSLPAAAGVWEYVRGVGHRGHVKSPTGTHRDKRNFHTQGIQYFIITHKSNIHDSIYCFVSNNTKRRNTKSISALFLIKLNMLVYKQLQECRVCKSTMQLKKTCRKMFKQETTVWTLSQSSLIKCVTVISLIRYERYSLSPVKIIYKWHV